MCDWRLPEVHVPDEPSAVEGDMDQMTLDVSIAKSFSFTDAAEQVLKQFTDSKPMHYREVTRKALELDLIKTKGVTPEATLYSQILSENRRHARKGNQPRFVMHKGGLVGLSSWQPIEAVGLVQRVRGSLGAHDQGLIIMTSNFSSGATEEARRPNAVPVALMNGDQLVALLIEHNIGVHRISYDLIELGETDE